MACCKCRDEAVACSIALRDDDLFLPISPFSSSSVSYSYSSPSSLFSLIFSLLRQQTGSLSNCYLSCIRLCPVFSVYPRTARRNNDYWSACSLISSLSDIDCDDVLSWFVQFFGLHVDSAILSQCSLFFLTPSTKGSNLSDNNANAS